MSPETSRPPLCRKCGLDRVECTCAFFDPAGPTLQAARHLPPAPSPVATGSEERPAVQASQTLPPPDTATTVPPTPEARLCAGCGLPLDARQKRGEARHHGSRCRQLAYRARRRAEVLSALDAIGAEVARLRAQVERW